LAGVLTIARKEMGDMIRSRRFLMLEGVLLLLLLVAVYSSQGVSFMGFTTSRIDRTQVGSFLRSTSSGFQGIISFIGPILGIGLAVTVITGEREKGTMKMLLTQPIFRDNVLNGKFLAIASILAVGYVTAYVFFLGVGIVVLGITPTVEEAFRLLLSIFFSFIYTLAFAAIALLVSVVFRRTTTAVLVALSIFAFFIFALPLISYPIASAIAGPPPQLTFVEQTTRNQTRQVPSPAYTQAQREYSQKQQRIMESIQSISPSYHIGRINDFLQTSRDPQNIVIQGSGGQAQPRTYTLAEGLQLLGVNIAALSFYLATPFIASYIIFTRQEE
jgi:ABC-2 type transport system permease protein